MGKKSRKDQKAGAAKSTEPSQASLTAQNDDSDEVLSQATHLSLDDDDTVSLQGEEAPAPDDSGQSLEDRLSENLENAMHKQTSVRSAALANLHAMLAMNYMPETLDKWKLTLDDCIQRSLRKPLRKEELITVVRLLGLMAIQLGVSCSEILVKTALSLQPNCIDAAQNIDYRSECCSVLGLVIFLCSEEPDVFMQGLACLRTVWSTIKPTSCTDEQSKLFSSALSSWSLLLLQAPNRRIDEFLNKDLSKLTVYLDCPLVEIRIVVGEALALIYEMKNEVSQTSNGFRAPNHQQFLETFEMLSKDSLKFRAKKDRRMQRVSFRQIFSAIKGEELSALKVKFGDETLELDSWAGRAIYNSICLQLKGGLNIHLKNNILVREVFELGPPLDDNSGKLSKLDKANKRAIYQQVSKAQTLNRGKQRKKRMEAQTYEED